MNRVPGKESSQVGDEGNSVEWTETRGRKKNFLETLM